MASLYPLDLETYCNVFNISFFELQLKCVFCKCTLNIIDLARFVFKKLCLVWRDNVGYACCNKCLHLSARYESEKYTQCAVEAKNLHALIQTPLQEILLRCMYCLGCLDLQEKIDLISRGKHVLLIRGYWRGCCRECMDKEL
uniref:Protein E6 n=1 Tax=Human papillomavirus TaxID=10566 RepID=H2BQC1_9PAPI|nr:E6 protein [Human papillomavirus]